MKGFYSFYWDYGRMGDVSGVFIADEVDVKNIIGKNVYFGEILGKHSEVYGIVEEKDIELKTNDQAFISKFEGIMGEDWSSGYNPLDYYEGDEEDEYEDEEE